VGVRCRLNKITCVKGVGRRKACAACIKAKQRCDGGVGQVEQAEVDHSTGPAVAEVLGEMVKVLRSLRHNLHDIKVAIKDRWGGEGDDELEEGYVSELGVLEVDEDVVGLEEDAVDYCAFWLKKYREEYEEGGVVEQEKDGEKGGEEKGQQSEGERMEVDAEVAGLSGSTA
jgi:hypothetical protein